MYAIPEGAVQANGRMFEANLALSMPDYGELVVSIEGSPCPLQVQGLGLDYGETELLDPATEALLAETIAVLPRQRPFSPLARPRPNHRWRAPQPADEPELPKLARFRARHCFDARGLDGDFAANGLSLADELA
jgi:hypothetical protein